MFWQPARSIRNLTMTYAYFCPAKHDVYSVLSAEGGLNVNIGYIVYNECSFYYVIFLFLSKGGIICRGILETMSDHNVHTFIALSSPQMGQYGGKTTQSVNFGFKAIGHFR